jgi:hypothetical protein
MGGTLVATTAIASGEASASRAEEHDQPRRPRQRTRKQPLGAKTII